MFVRRILLVELVVVACVALALLFVASQQRHTPTPPDRVAQQQPLVRAADRIEAAMAADPSGDGDQGFAGMQIAVPRREVTLFWKGTPSPVVADALAALRSAGLRIVVARARFSRDELLRRAEELKDAERYPGLVSISVPADGTGLDVGVLPGTDTSGLGGGSPGGVAIRVHREQPIAPLSIRDDAEPVSAGSDIAALNGDGCGSSFSAWRWTFVGTPPTPVRAFYTLAAAHCKGEVGANVFAGNGPPIGTVESVHQEVDSIAVRTTIWSLPRMYERQSPSSWRLLPVGALGSNRVGTYVCQAGVRGGPHCDLKITGTDKSVWFQDHWVSHLVVAALDDAGAVAAIEGDSGSPVYAPDGANVLAMGSLYGPETPLDSCPAGVGRCASAIRYVDLGEILKAQHLSLAVAGDPAAWPPVVSLTNDAAHARVFVHVHPFNLAAELSPVSGDAERQASTFWNLRSTITAPGGSSLESTSLAGFYLWQRLSAAVLCPERKTAEFSQAATFRWQSGFADPQGTSLEPLSLPGRYLHLPPTGKGTPTTIGTWLSFGWRPDSGNIAQWDRNATFYAAAPLSNPQSAVQVQAPTDELAKQACGP
jgi:hypothetical protein